MAKRYCNKCSSGEINIERGVVWPSAARASGSNTLFRNIDAASAARGLIGDSAFKRQRLAYCVTFGQAE